MQPVETIEPATLPDVAVPQMRRPRQPINFERFVPILMIAPSVIAIAIFVYGFIGWTGVVSFSAWKGLNPDFAFVGIKNYIRIFGTSRFQTDIRNTVVFTCLFIIGCMGIGLLLALLLDTKVKGEAIYRSIFLFPMGISFIVTGTAWGWLFSPGTPDDPHGLNSLFHPFGLFQDWSITANLVPSIDTDWLRTTIGIPLAMLPVIVAAIWQLSGYTMAIYLAGLRSISDDLREAARVDGGSEMQIVRYIILPLLQPITLSAIIILGHISLKIFDLIMAQTGGHPGNATDVPGINMYETTFKSNAYAEGGAIAVVMLLLVAVLIVPYLIYTMRHQTEQ